MEAKAKEVCKVFDDFWTTWALRKNKANTINDIIPFFDRRVTAIGTGDHEKGRNFDEVIQNFHDDFKELEVPFQLHFLRKKARLLNPEVGLVEAEAMLEIHLEQGNVLKFHLRFSTTFILKKGRWKIIHNHVSIPYDGQNVGEAYPIDELKAKNDRLKKKVEERTKKLRERTLQLQVEKENTERLLHNILPKVVARELMETGRTEPARFEEVSVLFSDFVGFTKVAAGITPRELVEELNDIFFHFDNVMKAEKLEKIKTIGDCYMAVCGLPEYDGEHALRCVTAARKMLQFLEERNSENPIKWNMRVGIHSGPVVAGVVGNHKFTYDLWGNTVNIASRLENASHPGKINISQQTYTLVNAAVHCDYRGKVKVKGDQEIDMFFVS